MQLAFSFILNIRLLFVSFIHNIQTGYTSDCSHLSSPKDNLLTPVFGRQLRYAVV